MDPNLSLTVIEHPFRRDLCDTILVPLSSPVSLLDLRIKHFPSDLPVIIYLNGGLIPENKWSSTFPKPTDYVMLTAALSGGGGGKGFLRILLMIAAIAANFLIPGSGFWIAMAKIGIMVGGLLISSLLTDTPKTSKTDSALDTTAYSWAPQNTEQQGIPLARWYGFHKVYGNIIGSYIETFGYDQFLNMLVCIGLGPIAGVGDFKLNDQPITNFKAVEIETRNGFINQPALTRFVSTKTEYSNSVEVIYGTPYTYVTVGSDFDGLEVDISFPEGIWKASSTSSDLQAQTVDMRVEVRKSGTSTWTNITKGVDQWSYDLVSYGSNEYNVEQNAPQWSEGKLVTLNNGEIYWWNKLAHPADSYWDHREGDAAPMGDGCTWHWMGPWPSYVPGGVVQFIEQVAENCVYNVQDCWRFTGSATEPITFAFKYSVPSGQQGQHEIRLTRVSTNANLTTVGDKSWLGSVREVMFDAFEYPRQALVALRIKATDQISGSIKFSCIGKHAIVRVWTGSAWTIEWSNNPAWVMYDIFTQPVFAGEGTGVSPFTVIRYDGMDPSRMDYIKFKEWADYCDDLVPNGSGGTEKRITFNGGFDFDCSVWEAALRVGQVGRAIPIWNGSHLTLAIDKPSDPVNLYSVGNIDETKFKEIFLPLEERATLVEIDFTNEEYDYQRDKLTVYRPDVAANQYRATLDLFGITKPSEAWRAGMYRLNCNRYLIRSAEIDIDLEALNAQLGDVVYIQHDVPRWGEGGRVISGDVFDANRSYTALDLVRYGGNTLYYCRAGTPNPSPDPTDPVYWDVWPTNWVKLDKEVTIAAGTYSLMLRNAEDVIYELTVASPAGTYSIIEITPAFDASADFDPATPYHVGDTVRYEGKIYACIQNTSTPPEIPANTNYWGLTDSCPVPENYDVYALGLVNTLVKPFRITDMSLKQQDQKATLTLVEYREEVYEFEEIDPSLNDYLHGLGPLAPPSNLQVQEYVAYLGDIGYAAAVLSWQRPPGETRIGRFQAWRTSESFGWEALGKTYGTSIVMKPIAPGAYTFNVASLDDEGRTSTAATVQATITGNAYPDVREVIIPVGDTTGATDETGGAPIDEVPDPEDTDTVIPSITGLVTYAESGKTYIKWTAAKYSKKFQYHVKLGDQFDQAKNIGWYAEDVTILEVTQEGTYWVTAWRTLSKDPFESFRYIESATPASVSVNLNYLVAAAEIKANTLTLTWNLLKDAVITGYDFYGTTSSTDNWNLGTLLASVGAGVSTYSWPWAAVCGYQRLWVVAKAGAASLYKAAYADVIHPTPVDTINVAFADPNLIVSWPAVSGASGYRIWILGGIGQVYTLTNTQITTPISPFDMKIWVEVMYPDGRISAVVERAVAVDGLYRQNEVVNVNVDFSAGTFVNMTQVSGSRIQRPSIKGGTVAAPYVSGINDSDLWNNVAAFAGIPVSSLNCPVSWFRSNWWRNENARYESPVVDLGDVVSGRLCGRLNYSTVDYTTNVSDLADIAVSSFSYLPVSQLVDNRVALTAKFQVSTDNSTWTDANINDWVTARYVKFVALVLVASPLLDITITSADIVIDVPDLVESGVAVLTGGAVTKAIAFTKAFTSATSSLCIAQGTQKAWGTGLPSKTGFTINLDSNPGSVTVDWQVKGY